MKKMLLATDFDGTLCFFGRVSKKTCKYIRLFQQSGGKFGIVTGRGPDFTETVKAFDLKPDFLALHNGAIITGSDGSLIYGNYISEDAVSRLAEFTENLGLGMTNITTPDGSGKYSQFYAYNTDVVKTLSAAEKINAAFADEVTAFVNGSHLNVAPKGSGKAESVEFMLNYYSLPSDAAAVAGDDYNDLEMIKRFDGWAMKTGKAAVRKAASHTAASVGELAKNLIKD